MRKTGAAADAIDLGGGFGVSYRPGFSGPEPDACAKAILTQIQALPEALRGLSLQMSPGRFLAAACGTLVTRVRAVKPGPAPLAVLDVDPAQCPRLVKKRRIPSGVRSVCHRTADAGAAADRRYAGRSGHAPPPAGASPRGDLVLIGMLGADGRSLASRYGGAEPCLEHLIRPDGEIVPITAY